MQICLSLIIDAACTSFLNHCILHKTFRVLTLLIHALSTFLVPYAHERAQAGTKSGSSTDLIEQRVEYINEKDKRNRLTTVDILENWFCQKDWDANLIHYKDRLDVAVCGLDVPHVVYVVNYDLPNEIGSYVPITLSPNCHSHTSIQPNTFNAKP